MLSKNALEKSILKQRKGVNAEMRGAKRYGRMIVCNRQKRRRDWINCTAVGMAFLL